MRTYPQVANRSARQKFDGRRGNALAPSWLEICSLAGLFLAYLAADELFGEKSYLTVNLVGPLMMTAILGIGAWRLVRSDGKHAWTALMWFRLSTAVYFGIGTYAVFIMNDASRLYIESFYQFFDADIYKMNLVVTLSVAVVLLFARFVILAVDRNGGGRRMDDASSDDAYWQRLRSVGLLFIVVGQTISYGLKIPQHFGWTSGDWPGSILQFSDCTLVGIFMLTLWTLSRAPRLMPLLILLVGVELLMELLMFNKSGILKTLIMFLLAFLWRKLTIARAVVAAVAAIGLYVAVTPVVTNARSELGLKYGQRPAGFLDRLQILTSYGSASTFSNKGETQDSLLRISYVNAATLVIREYDMGMPANWPELLPAVFVPRFLWPEKPIITDVGLDIYEIGTGRRNSSSGAGIFADAYWAMGWWGVLVYMAACGLIMGGLSAMTARVLREGWWMQFPVVLMALLMGFRTDGHYIADVAGASVMLIGMYGVLAIAERVLAASGLRRAKWRPSSGAPGVTALRQHWRR